MRSQLTDFRLMDNVIKMEKKMQRGGRYLLCKEGFYSNGRRIKRVFTNYLRVNVRDNRG